MKNREIFQRDPVVAKLANDGVAKVSESQSDSEAMALKYELEHFVCEGQYRGGMERILQSYLGNTNAAAQPAAWVSGFYGSGKSHLLKMFRHLWVDTQYPQWQGASARSLVTLPDDISDLFAELDTLGKRCKGTHAASGTLPSGGGESARLAVLGIVLQSCGLPASLPQARFLLWLRKNGIEEKVRADVEAAGRDFIKELHDLYVSPVLANAVIAHDPSFAENAKQVRQTIRAQFPVVNDVSTDEFIRIIREVLLRKSQIPCTVLVLDEIQLYIGDSKQRSSDVQEVAEALCKQLDSRVLLIGAGQTALAASMPLLQRLQGRFTIPVELSDTDVETVTRRVVLAKKADKRKAIEDVLGVHAGEIDRQLSGTKICATADDRKVIVDDYPMLPVRRRFWEHVLRAVDIPGTASQLRTQLRIVYDAVRETAEEALGHVMPADYIFNQLQADLLRTGVLLREIDETIRKLDDGTDNGRLARRLCGLIFLIRKLPREKAVDIGVRADADTLADLMVSDLAGDGPKLRAAIPTLLDALVDDGTLIKIDREYSLQTRESAEWDREFRNRQTKLNNDGAKISAIRSDLLKAACAEALKGVKLLHGQSKVVRKTYLHFGPDDPRPQGNQIPVWVRDQWGAKESQVVADARAAGSDSPIVFVFIPRRSATDLQKAIVDYEAAESTLGFKGAPSSDEGRDARSSMATRKITAEQTRNQLVKELLDEAKVFQGGGNEAYGLTLTDKVKLVAEHSMDRMFPRFRDADDARWSAVITRAKAGSEDALQALGWQGTPESHPVCSAVLNAVGSGAKGKQIRDQLEGPPTGWPRDAIDGALIALVTTGHLRATLKGTPLRKGQLDQAKVSSSDFQAETTTIGAAERIALRKLFQAMNVPFKPGDESNAAALYLQRLAGLATTAGGDPPMPSRPSTATIDTLRGLGGNDQLAEILKEKGALQQAGEEWKRLTERAAKREPEWRLLVQLRKHADGLADAAAVIAQMDAVESERRLLDDTDPLPPLRKELCTVLRKAVTKAHSAFKAEYEGQSAALEANDAWNRLPPQQQEELLTAEGIGDVEELGIASDEELLTSLNQTRIPQWRTRTAALPQQFGNLMVEAARLLEPKVQTVRLNSGTLWSEDDVKQWVKSTEEQLLRSLEKGPVVIG